MINGQAIEKYIKMLIDQNITRFVIYPYGVNGKSIHQVLKNEFTIFTNCSHSPPAFYVTKNC